MKGKVEFVDYQDSVSVEVGRFLLCKGFDLANDDGVATPQLVETDSLGILRRDAKPRKYLFGLITRESRRTFLGTVWFSNSRRGTNKHWVFEAYGRKHVELVKQLAGEMASTFGVNITLRLVCEQPDVETYLSEVGYDW